MNVAKNFQALLTSRQPKEASRERVKDDELITKFKFNTFDTISNFSQTVLTGVQIQAIACVQRHLP